MRLIPVEAAPTIALASLVISLATVTVAIAALRKGGPSVKVRAKLVTTEKFKKGTLEVDVINTGRADVTFEVDELYVEQMPHALDEGWFSPSFDQELPCRVAANSALTLRAPATLLLSYNSQLSSIARLRVRVGGRRREIAVQPPPRKRALNRKPAHEPLE